VNLLFIASRSQQFVGRVTRTICHILWRVSRTLHLELCVLLVLAQAVSVLAASSDAIVQSQAKMVKIYGAGGYQGMEAYQSGILISRRGHVLTAYSYVLDTDFITVVLADGRKFEAKLLGADPRLEIAVLKVDGSGLPCFDLDKATSVGPGDRVLALSNLFGVAMGNEPVSVQRGMVSIVTRLEARRGVFATPYRGPIYVLDITTNNPGAAGGAVVTSQGRLAGILGKELRNSLNNTWLNYAVPIEELRQSVEDILSGKFAVGARPEDSKRPERPINLLSLGIVLVPDVLERTPPYVDYIRPGSPAAAAGIRPDDLIVLLGDRLIQSCKALASDLEQVDIDEAVTLTVLRQQELIEITLRSTAETPVKKGAQP
jgi:S1-C subfamily serine protease